MSDSGRIVTSTPAFLGVNPRLVAPPQSQTVPLGGEVVLSVTAEGAGPLRYRWMRENRFLPGQTNHSLRLPSVTTAEAGNYTVVVQHELNGRWYGTRSEPAGLTISTHP